MGYLKVYYFIRRKVNKQGRVPIYCRMQMNGRRKDFSIFKWIEMEKWVKSSQVSEMLSCSPATLCRLRTEGILPCSLIQGTYYYKLSDIDQIFLNELCVYVKYHNVFFTFINSCKLAVNGIDEAIPCL